MDFISVSLITKDVKEIVPYKRDRSVLGSGYGMISAVGKFGRFKANVIP